MRKIKKKHIVEIVVWIIYILFISRKLFQDSVRYDEAVEYYVSICNFSNMFDLTRKTFQPPFYNMIMHFWLMINSSTEWYRMFNMLCSLLGTVALFKSVSLVTGSKRWGYVTVFITTCFCSFLYYHQICGEYTLLLCLVSWCIYFFSRYIKKDSLSNLIGWIVFSVLAMYTQYGAFIPVVGMALILFIKLLIERKWRNIMQFMIGCIVAGVIPGGVLIKAFLLEQLEHQGAGISLSIGIDRIVKEPYEALEFLIYCFSTRHTYRNILIGFLLAFVIICVLVSKKDSIAHIWNRKLTFHLLAGVVTWGIYCIATCLGIYGYGEFGSRHTLACLPTVIYITSIISWAFYRNLQECKLPNGIKKVCNTFMILILLVGMYNGFDYINQHWNYEQDDVAYEAWKENVDEDTVTYVYWYCAPQFMYYHNMSKEDFYDYFMNGNYQKDNIIFPSSCDELSYDKFKEQIISKYGNPKDRCIFIYSGEGNEIKNTFAYFTEEGYLNQCLLNETATKEYLFER